LEGELRSLEARLSPEQLDARIKELESQAAELEARAAPLRAGGAELVTPAQKAAAEASLARCLGEWRRRRGVFRAIWDAVSEGIEGKQSDLFEEIGVETDEAAGVCVQEVGSLLEKGAGRGGGGLGAGGGKAPPQMAAGAGGSGLASAAGKKARAG
jgi:26S proteasome regulatory subunit (ATPase 3-interacting protein)